MKQQPRPGGAFNVIGSAALTVMLGAFFIATIFAAVKILQLAHRNRPEDTEVSAVAAAEEALEKLTAADRRITIERGWFTTGAALGFLSDRKQDFGAITMLPSASLIDPPQRVWLSTYTIDAAPAGLATFADAEAACAERGQKLPTRAQIFKANRIGEGANQLRIHRREWARDALDFSNVAPVGRMTDMELHTVRTGKLGMCQTNDHFKMVRTPFGYVLRLEWESTLRRWSYTNVINPVVPAGPDRVFPSMVQWPAAGTLSLHAALNPRYDQPLAAIDSDPDTVPLETHLEPHAAFRCVDEQTDEATPVVPDLAADSCRTPFVEPGYVSPIYDTDGTLLRFTSLVAKPDPPSESARAAAAED